MHPGRKIIFSLILLRRIVTTKAPDFVADSAIDRLATDPRTLFGSESVPNERPGRANDTKPLSWIEYFGLGYVTVTKTVVHSVTAKYYNPSTIFSYFVKGCRPTILPFNLQLCNNSVASHPIYTFSKEVHYAP